MYLSNKAVEKVLEDIPTIVLSRVSSKQQSNVQHGSLEQQKNFLFKKIQETSQRTGKNYRIIEIIEEDESGKSANTKNRSALKIVERLIKSGQAKALFADRTDRFSRDLQYNIRFANMIMDHKAEYHEGETGWIDFRQENQYFGFIYRSFAAEAYSKNLSKTVRTQGRRARVNNGKDSSTVAVYSLEAHPTLSCQYVILEDQQKNVEEAGWYLVKTKDQKAAAKFANQLGIRTKERWTKESVDKDGNRIPPKKMGGKLLTAKSLQRLLYSPKLWGVGKFKDDLDQYIDIRDEEGFVEFKYSHGPVLSEELIRELSKLSEENKKHSSRHSEEYLLTSFLYTSDGKKYRGDSSTKNNSLKKYTYYEAPSTLHKGIKRIKTDLIDDAVICRLKEYLSNSDVFKKLLLSKNENFNKKIIELEKEIEGNTILLITKKKELDQFSAKIRELVLKSGDELHEMLQVINSEKIAIEMEAKSLQSSIQETKNQLSEICHKVSDVKFLDALKTFFGEFDSLPRCDKKILLKAFFPQIVIHSNFQIELRINSGFADDLKSEELGSENKVRIQVKWLGRWDSNPRPID